MTCYCILNIAYAQMLTNHTICSGSSIHMNPNAMGSGQALYWAPSTGLNCNKCLDPVASPTTTTVYAVYTLTPTGGQGTFITYDTVEVTPSITPTLQVTASANNVCAGTVVNYTAASNVAGGTYKWQVNEQPAGTNNSVYSYAPTNLNRIKCVYKMPATGCYTKDSLISSVLYANVKPVPSTPVLSNFGNICQSCQLVLSAATNKPNVTWQWTGTGPNAYVYASSTTVQPTLNGLATGNYSFTVKAILNGCVSPASTATATVVSQINATLLQQHAPTSCSGSDGYIVLGGMTANTQYITHINKNGKKLADRIYNADSTGKLFIGAMNNNTYNYTGLSAGTYEVSVSRCNCSSNLITNIYLNDSGMVTPIINSNTPVCTGTSATLNLTSNGTVGTYYNWSGPNNFSSTSSAPTILNPSTAATGKYYVSVFHLVNGVACVSAAASAAVEVKATPGVSGLCNTSNAPCGASVCEGQTINFTSNATAGSTYNWAGPNGWTAGNIPNPTITNATVANHQGVYTLTVSKNGCTSVPYLTTTSIRPMPIAPNPILLLASDTLICSGKSLTLTCGTSNLSGSAYIWSGPNNVTYSTFTPKVIIPNMGMNASGVYSVKYVHWGCATPSVSMTVNVKETPATPELTINNQNCPCDVNNTDGIFILNATTTATGTDNWQITGTGPYAYSLNSNNSRDTIDATTLHGGSYTYKAVVAKNGCLSNAAIAVLRIKDNTSISVKSNKSAANNGVENVASELHITENGNNNATTSVATAEKSEDVLYLYPNPNKGSFTIAGQLSEVTNGQTVTVEVVNMSGQIIARETVEVTNGQLDKKMNVATDMPAGMYFLRVATQEHSYSLRFNIDK